MTTPDPSTLHTLTHNLAFLDKAVELLEPRFTTRALRALPALRKSIGGEAKRLAQLLKSDGVFEKDSAGLNVLVGALGPIPEDEVEMQLDEAAPSAAAATLTTLASTTTPVPTPAPIVVTPLPERTSYLYLLTLLVLLDSKKYDAAKEVAWELISLSKAQNRRTMDQITAKAYFYWVLAGEKVEGGLGKKMNDVRATLLSALRTATLHSDLSTLSTLLPLLLRLYLQTSSYTSADRLISHTTFPTATAANAQVARWCYYVARVRAVQLSYTEAGEWVGKAVRRAVGSGGSKGFLQTAHKLQIIIQLLTGEIPERSLFRQPALKTALAPYLSLVQAVRTGSLTSFSASLTENHATFIADKNLSLITRLRHTVLLSALLRLSVSYSRISLRDVCLKLDLSSEEDAEYVVAKAVRDGVIDAVVERNGSGAEVRTMRGGDEYITGGPWEKFDGRIRFLLELYNESVKAMRYPLNAHAKELASAGEARERERELVKEIEDAEDGDELDGPGDMDAF